MGGNNPREGLFDEGMVLALAWNMEQGDPGRSLYGGATQEKERRETDQENDSKNGKEEGVNMRVCTLTLNL